MISAGRSYVAWIVYWCDHLVSKTMYWEWTAACMYPLYNKLMLASLDIQGDGPGPWRDNVED